MSSFKTISICATLALAAWGQLNVRGPVEGTSEYPVQPLREVHGVAWEAKPGFRDFGPMASAGGVLVTGNITGTGGVFAFDTATGKMLWSIRGQQMKGGPAVDAEWAYVVTKVDGLKYRLNCLALKSGKPRWSVVEDDLGIFDASPLVALGRVYVISVNGRVKSFDAATGKAFWEQPFSPKGGTCPTSMAISNGILYFGGGEVSYGASQGRFLWALDAISGRLIWKYMADPEQYKRGGECVTAPAVADGTVVVTSENVLFALDARTGALRWKKEVRRTINGNEKAEHLAEPLISGGVVYTNGPNGLNGFDLRTGNRVFDLPGKTGVDAGTHRMAVAGGVLYFVADMETGPPETAMRWPLYALDLRTRQIIWRHRTNRPNKYTSVSQWRTRSFLPLDGALIYENEGLLAKVQ